MVPKMNEIFEKVTSPKLKSNLGGPAGGEALERASPPTKTYHMSRTAFVALRVIRLQQESRSNTVVKNTYILIMKIKKSEIS